MTGTGVCALCGFLRHRLLRSTLLQKGKLQILRGLQKHSRNEGADLKIPSKSLSQSSPKAKQKHSSRAWGFTFSKSQMGHFGFSLPEDKAVTLVPCSSDPVSLQQHSRVSVLCGTGVQLCKG